MAIRVLPSGSFLLEEEFEYPDPDIVVKAVTNVQDLKRLASQDAEVPVSLVYFYADRAVHERLLSYTGETKVALTNRHTSTHSRKEWFQQIQLPLIGTCESKGRPWDTDTRLSIEATIVSRMSLRGFKVANSSNKTWNSTETIRPGVNKALVEEVAKIVVRCQLAWLGLSLTGEETEDSLLDLDGFNEDEDLESQALIWTEPQEGRKLHARGSGWEAWADQTEEGFVILTKAIGIPATVRANLSELTKARHAQLLKEGTRSFEGMYSWSGKSSPERAQAWLSAVAGKNVSDIWEIESV